MRRESKAKAQPKIIPLAQGHKPGQVKVFDPQELQAIRTERGNVAIKSKSVIRSLQRASRQESRRLAKVATLVKLPEKLAEYLLNDADWEAELVLAAVAEDLQADRYEVAAALLALNDRGILYKRQLGRGLAFSLTPLPGFALFVPQERLKKARKICKQLFTTKH